ncbi:DMT family transporter [Ideonella sp. 4Y16]|uniref:DMT family transporter n=1 Tax=Ideonella alba TaxID=2824118 RepID=A0A940YBV7_9BURK|nr:DMT family transporter [Ideonella alba]MBQ0930206.1 DMT family transporter [Ideonella alba]MBQ0943275.1 DMT family transporter [Ideonella alba]
MTDRRTQLDAFAVVCLVGCAALWGLNQVASKVAVRDIPPLLQAGLRSAGAALLLWAWARRQRISLNPFDGTLRGGLLAGVLFAAEFGCIFVGLQYTTASRMAVFIYLSPFVVALGMPLVAPAERLRGAQLAGLVAAFAGVVWAFAEGFSAPAAGPQQWWGDALGVLAALLWGSTTLAIRASRLSTAPPEKTLMYQLAVSAVLLLAASTVAGEAWPRAAAPTAWGLLAFQIVIVTFASYLLWFWLVRHYQATQVTAFTLLTPIFGLLFGAWLLAEPLTARLLVAVAAVSTGIWLVSRPRR